MATREVVVLDAVCAPIGKLGGAQPHFRPDDLAARTLTALVGRHVLIPSLSKEWCSVRPINRVRTIAT